MLMRCCGVHVECVIFFFFLMFFESHIQHLRLGVLCGLASSLSFLVAPPLASCSPECDLCSGTWRRLCSEGKGAVLLAHPYTHTRSLTTLEAGLSLCVWLLFLLAQLSFPGDCEFPRPHSDAIGFVILVWVVGGR